MGNSVWSGAKIELNIPPWNSVVCVYVSAPVYTHTAVIVSTCFPIFNANDLCPKIAGQLAVLTDSFCNKQIGLIAGRNPLVNDMQTFKIPLSTTPTTVSQMELSYTDNTYFSLLQLHHTHAINVPFVGHCRVCTSSRSTYKYSGRLYVL